MEKTMVDVWKAADSLSPLGFETVKVLPGTTYQDNSTVIVVPTRGMIHHRVVACWQNLIAPMNQKRAFLFAAGHEVGRAYDAMVHSILDNPVLKTWKYLLTLEEDNLVPNDAHIRLLEAIEFGKFDAVGGLYFTKGLYQMPMCYGDPEEYAKTGVLDFRPRNIAAAIASGQIVECNGLAMGCTLYRMDLFREIPPPWFVTVSDVIPEKGPQGFTQDLYFCQRMKAAGKRVAVDTRVRVGHLDVENNVVY